MIKTEAEAVSVINMLVDTASWNPHAKFLVFVDWLEREWISFVIFVLREFWKYFVINITISIPPNWTNTDTKANPFLKKSSKVYTIS